MVDLSTTTEAALDDKPSHFFESDLIAVDSANMEWSLSAYRVDTPVAAVKMDGPIKMTASYPRATRFSMSG